MMLTLRTAKVGSPGKGVYDHLLSFCINTGEDCLVWPFATGNGHKGRGTVWSRRTGKHEYAHREICVLINGPATADKPLALHSCGNGHLGCVNPNHLYWGSYQDNANDRDTDNRTAYGDTHKSRKLNSDQALAIYRDARVNRVIAAEYGVSEGAVAQIKCGRKWVRAIAEKLASEAFEAAP